MCGASGTKTGTDGCSKIQAGGPPTPILVPVPWCLLSPPARLDIICWLYDSVVPGLWPTWAGSLLARGAPHTILQYLKEGAVQRAQTLSL